MRTTEMKTLRTIYGKANIQLSDIRDGDQYTRDENNTERPQFVHQKNHWNHKKKHSIAYLERERRKTILKVFLKLVINVAHFHSMP